MDLNYTPDEIQQLIKLLQKMLPSDQQDKDTKQTDSFVESKIKTKTRSSKQKQNSRNLFLDMPEKNMHKSDTAIDKKLSVNPPTPRNRKFNKIEVKCRVCGKEEKVNPTIVPESVDRYKCNKCSSAAGG